MRSEYVDYYPTTEDADQCLRCTCGLGNHSCWRAQIQALPALYAKKPVKITREGKSNIGRAQK